MSFTSDQTSRPQTPDEVDSVTVVKSSSRAFEFHCGVEGIFHRVRTTIFVLQASVAIGSIATIEKSAELAPKQLRPIFHLPW
jgi:hypothetical protein